LRLEKKANQFQKEKLVHTDEYAQWKNQISIEKG